MPTYEISTEVCLGYMYQHTFKHRTCEKDVA